MKLFRLLMMLLALLFWTQGAFADRYVDDDYCSTCPNDGYTWGTDAFNTIQAGIDEATAGETVHVAAGTYNENVTLANGVSVIGEDPASAIVDVIGLGGHVVEVNTVDDTTLFEGFTLRNGSNTVSAAEGTGMNLVDSNLTVRNCIFENNADSALMNNNSSPTIVDCTFRFNVHVGMRNRNNSNPIIENCTFEENNTLGMESRDSTVEVTNCVFRANVQNHASSQGGGMYNRDSSVLVTDCLFEDNLIDDEHGEILSWGGGGIYNVNGSLEVLRCEFTGNGGDSGGAIQNIGASPLTITGCVFTDNLGEYDGTDGQGGAIYSESTAATTITNSIFTGNTNYYGGAIYISLSNAPATITNCIFNGNSATAHGGAIEAQFPGSTLEIVNSVFYGNLADSNSDGTGDGGALYSERGYVEIVNSILWNNNGSEIYDDYDFTVVQYSDITGGYGDPSDENIDTDPLFVDAAAGNFRLQERSDCIDAGTSSSATVTLPTTDIEGTARPLGLSHDMGVYEYISGPDITVSPASLDFGSVHISSTQPLDITITNSGGQDLEITDIALSDATHFAITPVTLPAVIAPGGAIVITVDFTPMAAGQADADLMVTSNDPDQSPLAISLTGVGIQVTHTITASAGTGGRIDPDGAVSVVDGEDQTFTITADAGYGISDVLVDGASIGAVSSHTFSGVTAGHTIEALFAPTMHTITATAGAGGSIDPSGTVDVAHGSDQPFTITPDTGYEITEVLVDGVSAGAISSHTFSSITADHTIEAHFMRLAEIIVSPISGDTGEDGTNATFTIVLSRAPLDEVQMQITTTHPTEGVPMPGSMTFTPSNWDTPQTVTVSGQDDNIDDGDQAYTIEISAAYSTDSAFNGIDPDDIHLTNIDDDNGGGGGGGGGGCFIETATGQSPHLHMGYRLLAFLLPLACIIAGWKRSSNR